MFPWFRVCLAARGHHKIFRSTLWVAVLVGRTDQGFADATFTDNGTGYHWGRLLLGRAFTHRQHRESFADYHHIMIPYCTGDIHWGNQTQTYGSGNSEVTIHHKGGVNAQAVLDWVAENYGEPDKIFVTGCSAGAYGSIMWAPHVAEMYPEADLRQFGDSGAGVVTDEWFADSFPSWNGEFAFPTHIPALDPSVVDVSQKSTTDLYAEIASFYPEYSFSQFNAYYDRFKYSIIKSWVAVMAMNGMHA